MFSILHISDLHRTPKAKISNTELLSALVRDRDLYSTGDTPIRVPDAIIVSGDIVQGVSLRVQNGQAELRAQYEEAENFLSLLADEFLNSDRSRIVIVPGNHDIDWQVAKRAMQLVEVGDLPGDLLRALQEPDSPFRFSWSTREVFRIVDPDLYSRRFEAFWSFFKSFYAGVGGLLRVEPGSDVNWYSLYGGRIGIAGFNSCHGNDCFSFHGHIPASVIAKAHLDMRYLGPFELSVAVWHHNLEGPPYRTDYMDIEIVRAMMGHGFRVGMYGHQHRAQVSAQSLRLATTESMAILGTGALCAGGEELPNGSHRQYSIVEINEDLCSARVHVREIMGAGLFGPASLPAFGRRPSMDVTWDRPTNAVGMPIDIGQRALTAAITEAERLERTSCHGEAVTKLWPKRNQLPDYGRKLLLQATENSRDWPKLVELTVNPSSIEEFFAGVESRIRQKDHAGAKAYLDQHATRLQAPSIQVSELSDRIATEERLSK